MKIPMMMRKWAGLPSRMARWVARCWRQRRDEGFRLRVTRSAIMIITRSGGANGGGVYRVPRTRYLTVRRSEKMLKFAGFAGSEDMTVAFADAAAADRALRRIGRRLVSNRLLVWAGRGLALAVCWLLVSSYLTVRQRQQTAQTRTAAPAVVTQPAPMPASQGPLLALPGVSQAPDVDAMGPPAVAPSVPAPQKPAADQGDMGLGGFGLQLHPSAMTQGPASAPLDPTAFSPAQASAQASSGNGPGCDPRLAFQAPTR